MVKCADEASIELQWVGWRLNNGTVNNNQHISQKVTTPKMAVPKPGAQYHDGAENRPAEETAKNGKQESR